MKPTIGQIVHYVSSGASTQDGGVRLYTRECRAAIITAVNGPALDPVTLEDTDMWNVGLCVLNPTGMTFLEHCVQMERSYDGGGWHWAKCDERKKKSAPTLAGGA